MNNSLVCVDASIVIDRLIGLGLDSQLETLWSSWIEQGVQLVAPQLIRYEVTNAVFQITRRGQLSREMADEMIHLLLALPIQVYNDAALHSRALRSARDLGLGATYDAHYLVLAHQLNCELWTRDAKLVRAAQQQYRWVRLLERDAPDPATRD